MAGFKLPIPRSRSQIQGLWSDAMDNLSLALDLHPLMVASGQSVISKSIIKFGHSVAIPTGQTRDVWDNVDDLVYLGSAETINVKSSDPGDNPGGLGAHTVLILGLDNDLLEIQEVITLDGITDVPTVNEYKRIYRMVVVTADQAAGANSGAIGSITATAAAAATLQAKIIGNHNQTLMSHYTVPANKTGFIVSGLSSVGRGDDATVLLKTRPIGGVFNTSLTLVLFQQSQQIITEIPLGSIPAGTDIKIQGEAGTNNTVLHASYTILLIDKGVLE